MRRGFYAGCKTTSYLDTLSPSTMAANICLPVAIPPAAMIGILTAEQTAGTKTIRCGCFLSIMPTGFESLRYDCLATGFHGLNRKPGTAHHVHHGFAIFL